LVIGRQILGCRLSYEDNSRLYYKRSIKLVNPALHDALEAMDSAVPAR
jgi:hypothetical protein